MLVTQPTMLVTQPTQAPTTRLIPATMVRTVMAVLTTAPIGAKVDALRAEFIGDMNAGSKPGVEFTNGSGRNLHRVLDALLALRRWLAVSAEGEEALEDSLAAAQV